MSQPTTFFRVPGLAGVVRVAGFGAAATLWTIYAAIAALATILFPPAILLFLAPAGFLIIANMPTTRGVPQSVMLTLMTLAVALAPLWPVYLHVKLGPMPILTPPRIVLYAITACWLYDMAASRWRRDQFILAIRRNAWLVGSVFTIFGVGALSLPLAEGRAYAIPEFLRQAIIWLAPFCAFMTYVRRRRDFIRLLKALAIGGAISGAIAVAEAGTGTLLAKLLSPFIADDAEWLRQVQEQKIRDGIFRAQAGHTHPLSLGEYLAMSAPLSLAFAASARMTRWRLFWFAALVMTIAGAAATNSRGALLALAISGAVGTFIAAKRYLMRPRSSRILPVAGVVGLILLVASPVIAAGAYILVTGKGATSAANSSQSRIEQIEQALPKIMKRPVGGYGAGRAARVLGYWGRTLTIDNYYLSLALDYGVPGPAAFVSLLAALMFGAWRQSREGPPSARLVFLGLMASILAFAISRSITSQAFNLTTFYLMAGGFAGMRSGAFAPFNAEFRRGRAD